MRVLMSVFWALAIFAVLCFVLALIGPAILPAASGPEEVGRKLGIFALLGAILMTYFGTRDKVLPYSWAELKAARILIKVLAVFGALALIPVSIGLVAGASEALHSSSQAAPLADPKPSGIAGPVLTVGPCGYTFTAPKSWTWAKMPAPQGEAFVCSNEITNSKIILTVAPMPGRSFPVEGMRGFMKGVKGGAEKQNMTVVNDQFQSSDQPFKDSSYRATYTLQTASGRSLNFVAYVGFIHGQLLCVQCNAGETPELVAVLKSLTELK